jgi:hypothetical protein
VSKYWALRLLGLMLRVGAALSFIVVIVIAAMFASAGALPVALLYFCASLISPVALWALAQFFDLLIALERNTRYTAAAAAKQSRRAADRSGVNLWGDPEPF